ncbi:WD40 repeat domain-containing protein [Nitrosomonas ureae]|uniref:WD40 repeat domain-containing protein n=1 Tax=Nitrosomonas ureae TaxID=44577 RepID=UPI003B846F44
MATGSKDKTIILWQADTLESKQKIKGHDLGILDLAFTPDGKRLVSGSKDKTVRVWDVATGNRQAVLAAHSDVVNAVAIHGDYLATAVCGTCGHSNPCRYSPRAGRSQWQLLG